MTTLRIRGAPVSRLAAFAIVAVAFAGVASAADLGPLYKAPPQVWAPVAYDWSGFYLGGNVGVAWSNTTADPASFTNTGASGIDFAARQRVGEFPPFNVGDTGVTAGAQLGYNWQFAPRWVTGIETDLNFVDLDKTDTRIFGPSHFIGDGPIDANTESGTQKLSWLGTVRGRLGFTALDNRLLTFATGGFAYGRVEDSVQTIGIPNGAVGIPVTAASSSVRTGWALGAGAEYAFLDNWSAKIEYLHYDLGSQILTLDFAAVPGSAGNTFSYKFHDAGNLVRVGVNRRF